MLAEPQSIQVQTASAQVIHYVLRLSHVVINASCTERLLFVAPCWLCVWAFLTSLFGLHTLFHCPPSSDLWQSGVNGLEQDLCLVTGLAHRPLYPHYSHLLLTAAFFLSGIQAAGWGEGQLTFRHGHQTSFPFVPYYAKAFLPHIFDTLFLCVHTKRQGQAARESGVLVCGTELISTGIWRRKPRYLNPQTPSSLSFFLSPSLLWRLPPSCRLHHQVCEGCRCQLSLSWTTANLSSCLLSVVSSIFIHISHSTHLPQLIC